MAKQTKPPAAKPAAAAEPAVGTRASGPAFGVACPAPAGTVGTTSLVAYGWCADLPSNISHVIKCKVEKTTGTQFNPIPEVDATLYCGETPTLWSVEVMYPSTALTTDVLKLTATLYLATDLTTPIGAPVTRTGLVPDTNASSPIPTECPGDTELELDMPPTPLPLPLRTAAADTTRPTGQGQLISFEIPRPIRQASYAYARVSRKNAAGQIVRVLRIVPAAIRNKICTVRVPLPKNPNPNAAYYVADVFVHRDNGAVHALHSEVLGEHVV